jgi:lipopolysaccharide transport system ATP-binding protein
MTVRLGFAVAAFLEPEILVVDEVLAVGDAEFQKKAIGKMQNISHGDGRTVLFVSHNMTAIKTLCKTGILLENGIAIFNGRIDDAVDLYLKEEAFEKGSIIDCVNYHSSLIKLIDFRINNSFSNIVFIDPQNHVLNFHIEGIIDTPMKISLEVRLYDNNHFLLGVFSPGHLKGEVPFFNEGPFEINNVLELPSNMTKGEFNLEVALTHPNIESIVTFGEKIKLISKGITGTSGLSFDYKGCGLLML